MALLSPTRRMDAGIRLVFAVILAVHFTAAATIEQEIEEYQLKAAFLYNVAKFVEWPPEAFKSPTDPIVSCILGESPFSSRLEKAVSGKAIEDRKFVIRHISDARQVSGCHILFVSSSEGRHWRSIADNIKSNGLLTVGEADEFAADGGVMNFKLVGNKVHIEINMDAAEQERLRISSRLLSLSHIIKKQAR